VIHFSSFTTRTLRNSRIQLSLLLLTALLAPSAAQAQVAFNGVPATIDSGFNQPTGIAVDSTGNVYAIVFGGNQQLKETLQPDGTYVQSALGSGFAFPWGVAVDANGNVFIPNTYANHVVELSPSGNSYTQATLTADVGVGPAGIAIDASGNLYVSSPNNNSVFKETLSGGVYTKSTVASGLGNGGPYGVAVDANGVVYIADNGDSEVLVETPSGGSYTQTTLGTGVNKPTGVAVDAQGNVYISDSGNNRILKETLSGGSFTQSILNSTVTNPASLAADAAGNIYVANDGGGNFLELHIASVPFGSQAVASTSSTISLPFTVSAGTTIGSVSVLTTGVTGKDFVDAGSSTCTAQTYSTSTACVVNVHFKPIAPGQRRGAVVVADGSGDVLATVPLYGIGTGPQTAYTPATVTTIATTISNPYGLAMDAAGDLFIADIDGGQVLKISPGGLHTVAATGMYKPTGLALDGAGNLWVADPGAHAVWEVTPAGVQTQPYTGLTNPFGLGFDGAGNLYFVDASLDHITRISPEGVQTPLGSGFNFPAGVVVDNAGNAYVADVGNGIVHKITPTGVMTSFATGLSQPANLAFDAAGNLYVTEFGNGQVVEITPGGVQTTFVSAGINPFGIAIDGSGNLYYSDSAAGTTTEIGRATPAALTFVNTPIGTTSTDSPRPVSVENIGNASLTFSSFTYPADFPESSAAINDCSVSTPLTAGSTCSLSVDFTPLKPLPAKSTIALLSEVVSLTSNTLNVAGTHQSIAVSGHEIPPASSAPLIVTMRPMERLYGAANPNFVYTITGLLNGDTVTVTPQTTATLTSPVGTYPVSASVTGPDAAHYTINVVPSTLQVLKAPLYVAAANIGEFYGQTPVQPTVYAIHGFLNGDSMSVVTGAPVLSTDVTATTPVGFYRISVQVGTLSATNYYFDNSWSGEGNVGVYKAYLYVTALNASMTTGGTVPALTYTVTGFVNGESASVLTGAPSLTTSVTSATGPGHYAINISPGTLAAQNYAFALVKGTLTVNR
jgi:sugar lactone lactonase YvrE